MDAALAKISGTATAARKTPGPPSIRVLSTMVPSTNVTARVSSANSSPRSRRTRNTTAPIPRPRSAATTPAAGSVHANGNPKVTARVAAVYMPAPKNAPCPNEK